MKTIVNNVVYDSFGEGYSASRKSDPRIVDALHTFIDLPNGSIIAEIGAGTGNYSRALAEKGYKVKAIEPSLVMRNQSIANDNVQWIEGFAEKIPLDDASVDGVVIVLAIHHFTSLKAAGNEIHRICPTGPVVIFTCDPRESEYFWFTDYFPEIWENAYRAFPPIEEVIRDLTAGKEWTVERVNFPLPYDLTDKIMVSGWQTPEIYLNSTFRQGTSGFTLVSEESVRSGLERLRDDLDTGAWVRKYGYLDKQNQFNAGFQFLRFKPVTK